MSLDIKRHIVILKKLKRHLIFLIRPTIFFKNSTTYKSRLRQTFLLNDISMSTHFDYMSFNFLNNIYMLGAHLTYVTLFSSNIYMLAIYQFDVTQKHIYVIVAPGMCCSKNPTTYTWFFFVCSTPVPMSSPDTVSNFTVSRWDHRSSMVGYHDHFSTASSQRDWVSQSTLSHDNLANRRGRRSSSHLSPLSETRHASVSQFFAQKDIILIHVRQHMSICLFFFSCNRGRKLSATLFDQTGHECRRQCQLLQRETVKR